MSREEEDGDSQQFLLLFDWIILADAVKRFWQEPVDRWKSVSETKEQEKPESLKEPELLIYTFKLHKAP